MITTAAAAIGRVCEWEEGRREDSKPDKPSYYYGCNMAIRSRGFYVMVYEEGEHLHSTPRLPRPELFQTFMSARGAKLTFGTRLRHTTQAKKLQRRTYASRVRHDDSNTTSNLNVRAKNVIYDREVGAYPIETRERQGLKGLREAGWRGQGGWRLRGWASLLVVVLVVVTRFRRL